MPIDFSQVKKITIPEGDVKSISVGGVVIWEEASAKVLSSITLSGQTTSLNRGAAFSFGGTVTAHYSDSSTADVTSSTTFSGYNMSTAGTYTVTASYTEDGVTKTATYSLTVNKAWTTLWSGSKSISWASSSASTVPSAVAVYDVELPNPAYIRVTFTLSNKLGTYGNYYNVNSGGWVSSKPGSPITVTALATGSGAHNIVGVSNRANSSSGGINLVLEYYNVTSTHRFRLRGSRSNSEVASGTISVTVTKIERYY